MRTAAHVPRRSSGGGGAALGCFDADALQFFLIAVAYKIPWTAISSLLHQLNARYAEPRVLLWLNLAYFLPSLPSLLLHSSVQDALEARLGVGRASAARFVLGLGSLVGLCLAFPAAAATSLQHLLLVTAAVGTAYSVAFGTSHQLAPHFSPKCTVALTTGFVSCGLVVLAADLILHTHAAAIGSPAVLRMFQVVAVQVLVGLLAALLLLRRHWRRLLRAGCAGSGSALLGGSASKRHHVVVGLLPPPGPGIAFGAGRQMLLPRSSWEGGQQQQQQLMGAAAPHQQPSYLSARQYNGSHQPGAQQQQLLPTDIGGGAPSYAAPTPAGGVPLQQQYGPPAVAMPGGAPVHYAGFTSTAVSRGAVAGAGGSGWSQQYSSSSSAAHHASGWDVQHHEAADPAAKQRRPPTRGVLAALRARLAPLLLLLRIGWRIWPASLALLLSVGSSMLVFPLFTYVGSDGALGSALPHVLFYARLGGDIAGRLVPPRWQLTSSRALLAAAALKTKLLVLLVPALLSPRIVGGDLPLVALVAINWWLSGYVNTGAYLLAPALAVQQGGGGRSGGSGSAAAWQQQRRGKAAASVGVRGGGGYLGGSSSSSAWPAGGPDAARLRAKAGGLMACCFQAACLLGLGCAFLLQFMLHNQDHPATLAAASAAAAATAATAALKQRAKAAAITAVRSAGASGSKGVAPLLAAAGQAWNSTRAAAAAGLQGAAAGIGGGGVAAAADAGGGVAAMAAAATAAAVGGSPPGAA